MKINQIITESTITKDKVAKIIRHLVTHEHDLPEDILMVDVVKATIKIVMANPSTDIDQLINMVKDELGAEVDESGLLGGLSDKKLSRAARSKARSFKKTSNKLSNLISTHGGRFNKNLLSKLTSPVAEDEDQ